jgi:hypothetical protein
MALRILISALLLLAGTPPSSWSQVVEPETGTVRGRILAERRAGPDVLPNAVVSFQSLARNVTVVADSLGRYQATGLEAGPWRVRAVYVGFRSTSAVIRVPESGQVELDLSLRWEPIRLPAILVRADPVEPLHPRGAPPAAELGEMSLRALEGSPGMAEGGLAQVVRSLPGSDPSDPQDVLLMRGSAADLKLVLLDGAPVSTPFHMAGLLESFDPGMLGGASLFLGGAPARFDGGLSYIMNLQGRAPNRDRWQGRAAADLLTARFSLEGPLSESTGVLVGARSLHNQGAPVLSQGSSPYGFGDVFTRLHWVSDAGSEAFLTGFWNEESVVLDLSDEQNEALQDEASTGNSGLLGLPLPGDGARWGNKALSAGLSTSFGETRMEVRGSLSRYEAELPLGDSLPIFAQNRNDRVRLTVDGMHPWGEGTIRFGGSLDRLESAYSAMSLDTARVGQLTRLDLQGSSAGLYLEASRPLSQILTVRGGGRLDHFGEEGGLKLAPRLSLTWMLTEDAALTVAAGRYHQYSSGNSSVIEDQLDPDSTWSNFRESAALRLSVAASNHLVVSLDQTLSPGLRLGLEGFVKEFTGVVGSQGQSLNASGVDLRVAREGERTSGWLGYTLTWFWASDGILDSGQSPFSGRHLLSAGLSTELTNRTGLNLRASWGDGLPYTTVPYDAFASSELSAPTLDAVRGTPNLAVGGDQVLNAAPDLSVGPDEGFLRLEVEVYGQWSPRVSGRTMEIRPYIRVLNALNRRDALFYHFDPWRNEGPQPLADLPLLPLVGLEWRF